MDSEIKDLSYLSDSEKRDLTSIINEFKDNKDFVSLQEDISKSVAKGSLAWFQFMNLLYYSSYHYYNIRTHFHSLH